MELAQLLMVQKRNDEIPAVLAHVSTDLGTATEGDQLANEALVQYFLGNRAEAAGLLDRAYDAFVAEDDLGSMISARRNLAIVHEELGQPRAAARAHSSMR